MSIPKSIYGPIYEVLEKEGTRKKIKGGYEFKGDWGWHTRELLRIKNPEKLRDALLDAAEKLTSEGCQQIGAFMINYKWFDIKGFTPLWFDYRNAIIGGDEIDYEDDEGKVHTIKDDRPNTRGIGQFAGTHHSLFQFMNVPVYLLPFEPFSQRQPQVIAVPYSDFNSKGE